MVADPGTLMTQVPWPWRAQMNAGRAERRTASAKSLPYLREQAWGHRIDDSANDRITPRHMDSKCDASSDPRRRHECVRRADKNGPQ